MKIGGFQRLSLCDYPGTPAAVVFLQGCNLNCSFCHNRDLIPIKTDKPEIEKEEVRQYLRERRRHLGGVVITGGEPTLHGRLHDFLAYLKKTGIQIKLDTNGTYPEYLQSILEKKLVDYVAMDIKAPWDQYERVVGTTVDIDKIRNSMDFLATSGITHHFRTTKVDYLLGVKEMEQIRKQIPEGSKYVIQEYRPV